MSKGKLSFVKTDVVRVFEAAKTADVKLSHIAGTADFFAPSFGMTGRRKHRKP